MSDWGSREPKQRASGVEISPETMRDLAKRLGVSENRLAAMSKGVRSLFLRAKKLLVELPDRQISRSTQRDYQRKVAFLEKLAHVEPGSLSMPALPSQQWTAKRSWYAYRAAVIFEATQALKQGIHVLSQDHPESVPDARDRVLRLKNAIRLLETHQPDASGMDSLKGGETGDWVGNLAERKRVPRNARRKNLGRLNRLGDWIGQTLQHCAANVDKIGRKETDMLMVLAATGARPIELLRGITVRSEQDGSISCMIAGAKFKERGRDRIATGHKWRVISIDPDAIEGRYLASRLSKERGAMSVGGDFAPDKADRPRELRRLVALIGSEALGEKVSLSPYDFRHAVSARAKAADILSDEEIAMLLGQRSTRTQRNYGTAAQKGSGQRAGVVGVRASHAVRKYGERKPAAPTRGMTR